MTDDEPDAAAPVPVGPPFESMFVTEYPAMVALAAAVSGRRSHAEDIAAEAMSRLQRDWDRVGAYDKPGAWLRRVTINLALSQKRRFITEAKALMRLAGRPVAATIGPAASRDDAVWEAVALLPGKQRAAIALHYLEDRPVDEIAEILGCSPSTARVHLHRGRAALRERLASPAAEETDS